MYSYFSNKNHGESVYGMVPEMTRKEPRYVSRFSCKVRDDFYKNKKGQNRTMGKKIIGESPQCFLKKHTRCSPTFHLATDEKSNNDCDVKDSDSNNWSKPSWKNNFGMRKQNRSQVQCGYNGPVGYIERGSSDFIHQNAVKAARSLPSVPITRRVIDSKNGHQSYLERPYVLKKNFGRVPAYLQRRKCEMYEREMQLKRDIEASCERECREVRPDERRCIITGLEEKKTELTKEYYQVPLTSSNPRVQKLRNDIEMRLEDIGKDLALFKGSKKIFVSNKDNSPKYC